MKNLIVILLFLLTLPVLGQREAANWYFGNKAGLSFTSGSPSALLDGEIDSLEGCASISSAAGDLLFYTNGITVWNRNHQVMTNGDNLAGSDSATQTAVIVPSSSNSDQYYIFTVDAFLSYAAGTGKGLSYSIVAMNGLGEVTTKNINLLPEASEKITAVAAINGADVWLIAQFENKYYSYLVSPSGISSPVISTVPFNIDAIGNIRGSMKVSPKGDKLAVTHTLIADRNNLGGAFVLYDFDNTTGIVSNENIIDESLVFYGVEFSSDSSKLYATGKEVDGRETANFFVNQYNLEAADVGASKYEVAFIPTEIAGSDLGGSLQISINKKIYYSIPGTSISVINNPNLEGVACGFSLRSVDLGGRRGQFGLPPFVQSFFESLFTFENVCLGETTQFSVINEGIISTISWDFGDPASGANNMSTQLNPSHFYATPGTYVVTANVTFSDGRLPKQFIELVEVFAVPNTGETITLVQCDTDGVNDGLSIFNLDEVFSPGDGPSTINATFYRNLSDATQNVNPINPLGYPNVANGQIILASLTDSQACADGFVNVELRVESNTDLGDITLDICQEASSSGSTVTLEDVGQDLLDQFSGQSIAFFATENDALLETNRLGGSIAVQGSGAVELFFRIESDNDCDGIGGLIFNISVLPDVVTEEVILCDPVIGVELVAGNGSDTYEWSTGETTQSITVFDVGSYTVTLSGGEGCGTVSTYTVVNTVPVVLEVIVKDFQQENSITIQTNDGVAGNLTYSIDGGRTFQGSPFFKPVSPGTYNVVVTDNECSEATEVVIVRGAPSFFTPNNDGYNDRWHVTGKNSFPDLSVKIFDRYGKLLDTQSSRSAGWDGTYNGTPMPTGAFWYEISFAEERYTGHFVLIRR